MRAVGENVHPSLQVRRTQRGEQLVLFRELLVIAAVIRQQHVHDRAGNEDNNRRQQDGEPEGCESNHAWSPVTFEMRMDSEFLAREYPAARVTVKRPVRRALRAQPLLSLNCFLTSSPPPPHPPRSTIPAAPAS